MLVGGGRFGTRQPGSPTLELRRSHDAQLGRRWHVAARGRLDLQASRARVHVLKLFDDGYERRYRQLGVACEQRDRVVADRGHVVCFCGWRAGAWLVALGRCPWPFLQVSSWRKCTWLAPRHICHCEGNPTSAFMFINQYSTYKGNMDKYTCSTHTRMHQIPALIRTHPRRQPLHRKLSVARL
jgi:hypothetical protein